MKRGFIQQRDGDWPRFARRSVGIRLPDLAIQVPVSHRVKLLLLGFPILFLLISRFLWAVLSQASISTFKQVL